VAALGTHGQARGHDAVYAGPYYRGQSVRVPGATQHETVEFTWRDSAAEKDKTSFYNVRGVQSDGGLVWVRLTRVKYE